MDQERTPLTIEQATAFRKLRPDIAAGIVAVVASGIPVRLSCDSLKDSERSPRLQRFIQETESRAALHPLLPGIERP